MKKYIISLCAILAYGVSTACASIPYGEIQTGLIASEGSQAPIYGIRAGLRRNLWDLSIGYWAARGMRSDQLISDGLDLHTLSAEAYYLIPIKESLVGKIGGGLGYTIPNLNGGASETADNGHSWVFGGGVDYDLSRNITLGASLKGLFFTSDTHTMWETTSPDTLSNGQAVEVIDVHHRNDVMNLNSVLLGLSLRWR